jgi:predicted Zn-dependent protease
MKGIILALAAGLAAAAILLETGLRLGGCAASLGMLWHSWTRPAGAYRILCLGESTTSRQYPKLLEDILNERGQGRKFTVIDGGVPMINSNYVLAHLEENLARYHPDLIVAMIGNNDRKISYLKDVTGKDSWLFGHSRALRLAALLWRDTRARLGGGDCDKPDFPSSLIGQGTPMGTAREHRLRHGALLLDFGRVREAAVLLGRACLDNPQAPEAWLLMARLELARRQPGAAHRCLVRAEVAGADRVELSVARGRYYAAMRKLPAARSAFREAISQRKSDRGARQGLADILVQEGNVREAEEEYLSMARETPGEPEGWIMLGRFYHAQREYGKASTALRRGLRLNPERPQDWNILAQSCRLNCHPAAAESIYRELLRRWPALFASRTGLYASMLDQGKEPDGVVDFQEYVLRETHRFRELAQLLTRGGEAEGPAEWLQTETLIRQAVDKEPWNSMGYVNLGAILSSPALARHGEAERALRRALALDPENEAARVFLAQSLCRQKRWTEAAAQYREILARSPGSTVALGGLALAYERMHRTGPMAEARRLAAKSAGRQTSPITRENYLKIKARLDRSGIGLVAVQYPMRSVEPLRRMLEGEAGVTFVDNGESFQAAVAREGYMTFFVDNFAGDFGHCSERGNRLLASNIADTVLAPGSGHQGSE